MYLILIFNYKPKKSQCKVIDELHYGKDAGSDEKPYYTTDIN